MEKHRFYRLSLLLGIADGNSDLDKTYALYFLAANTVGCDFETSFGLFFTCNSFLLLVWQPIAGWIVDQYNPYLVLLLSSILETVALAMIYSNLLPFYGLLVVWLFRQCCVSETSYAVWKVIKRHSNDIYGSDFIAQDQFVSKMGTAADLITETHELCTLGVAYAVAQTAGEYEVVVGFIFGNIVLANTGVLLLSILEYRDAKRFNIFEPGTHTHTSHKAELLHKPSSSLADNLPSSEGHGADPMPRAPSVEQHPLELGGDPMTAPLLEHNTHTTESEPGSTYDCLEDRPSQTDNGGVNGLKSVSTASACRSRLIGSSPSSSFISSSQPVTETVEISPTSPSARACMDSTRSRFFVDRFVTHFSNGFNFLRERMLYISRNPVACVTVMHSFLLYFIMTIITYPINMDVATDSSSDFGSKADFCGGRLSKLLQQGFFSMIFYVLGSSLYMMFLVKCPPYVFYKFVYPISAILLLLLLAPIYFFSLPSFVAGLLVSICSVVPYYLNAYDWYLTTSAIDPNYYGFFASTYWNINSVIFLVPGLVMLNGNVFSKQLLIAISVGAVLGSLLLSIWFSSRYKRELRMTHLEDITARS